MKWSTLLSKVVFAGQPQPPPPPSPTPASPLSQQGDQADPGGATPRLSSASTSGGGPGDEGGSPAAFDGYSPSSAGSRGKHELESDFRRFWEEFRSSSSEKEKECRLVKQQSSVAQLVTKLIEAHVFAFVIGRAFVTDVEKLRIHRKGRSLHVDDVITFFSEITELGICPGSNLLYAVEVLVIEHPLCRW